MANILPEKPLGRPRRPTGRIIALGPQSTAIETGSNEIPFRPAYDLLELKEQKLTPQEVAAIGTALFIALGSDDRQMVSNWSIQARIEDVGQRY